MDVTWISTAEAAEVLGVGVRDVYRMIDEGRLNARRGQDAPIEVDGDQARQLAHA